MVKFKLSAVSMALIAGGLAVGSAESFAQCSIERWYKQTNVAVSDCTYSSSSPAFDSTGFFSSQISELDNSTLEMNNVKISLESDDAPSIILLNNSTATIKNSNLASKSTTYQLIDVKNSRLNISSSTLTNEVGSLISLSPDKMDVIVQNSTLKGESILDSGWKSDDKKGITIAKFIDSKLQSQLFLNNDNSDDQIHQNEITLENTSLIGAITFSEIPASNSQSFTNITLNHTQWTMPRYVFDDEYAENMVTNLALKDSQISLSQQNGLQTFTILGNLSGNGDFALNTDLANQQSDKIVVKGKDSGEFGLKISDSGKEPQSANGKVTLVETQTGTAKFALKDKDYVDAGAYRYRLFKEGTNWVLSNRTQSEVAVPPVSEQPATTEGAKQSVVSEDVKPSEQSAVTTDTKQLDKTTTQTTNTAPANHNAEAGVVIGAGAVVTNIANKVVPPAPQPTSHQVVLSEKSNALVSLRQAQLVQLENNLAGIHQRLGELKNGEKGNVWVRNVNGRNEFASTTTDSNSRSSGFTQNQHTLQLGADTAVSDNVRLGGFVGTSRSNVDFNGEYGSGTVKSQAVGLYGILLSDSGLYWDNLAKYEWLTAESASTSKRRYHAYTLSSEVGKIFLFGNEWKLTPNAQFAWTNLSGRGDEERISAVSSRLGLRFAKGFSLANGWNLQPYAEVNAINSQTNRNAVSVNQYRFEVAESGSRIETALGLTAGNSNHHFGLELKNSNGKRLDQPFVLQANYRYSW